jgi:signal peptidase I
VARAAAARLDRAGREALRFARDARRLARRHGRALGAARGEIEAAAAEVEAAAAAGEADRLSAALEELSRLWDAHLARRQKPLWREVLELALLAALLALATRAFLADTSLVRSISMEPALLPGDVLLVRKSAYAVRVPFTHLRLWDTGAPRRGDVVVFDDPRDPSSTYVKRVVGVPGDVVELREQVLLVNGVAQPRSPLGAYALAEDGGREGGGASICRRYREALAKGVLVAPSEGAGDSQARWDAAAAAGVASYDVLQCRAPRPDSRQGPFELVEPGHVFVLGDNRDRSADSRGAPGGWQIPYGHIRGRAALVLVSWGEGGWSPRGSVGLRLERLFKAVASR